MSTLDFYNQNAEDFASNTFDVDFSENQNRFLKYLKPEAAILDFGCGAGRDTKRFLELGYNVTAMDGSPELCRIASANTGIRVVNRRFQDLDEKNIYDGIWACASILHLPKIELETVLRKMLDALKDNGVIYTSFKYGEFEGERNGRYFTDFTESSFRTFSDGIPQLHIEQNWISGDARPGREDEKWLNLILKKVASN